MKMIARSLPAFAIALVGFWCATPASTAARKGTIATRPPAAEKQPASRPGSTKLAQRSNRKARRVQKNKSETQRKQLAVKSFMYGKLDATKQLMEGLVTEDYELILKATDKLRVMSMRTEWNVVKRPRYEQHSRSFRRSAELIAEAAKKKNVDGASLGFIQLTMHCINCHKYVRAR